MTFLMSKDDNYHYMNKRLLYDLVLTADVLSVEKKEGRNINGYFS